MDALHWEGGAKGPRDYSRLHRFYTEKLKRAAICPATTAYRNGKLQWTWEANSDELEQLNWEALTSLDASGDKLSGMLLVNFSNTSTFYIFRASIDIVAVAAGWRRTVGPLHWPYRLLPTIVTVPSDLSPTVCQSPAATATISRQPLTLHWPSLFRP
ncbi:MAG: hypothetical protein K0R28_143 [Paenibacillus sp.]|jgi:hypothetical protein|nr:hypothetical protein [Paenibacillus sp.]